MDTIKIKTSQNIELEYELASLGERVVGHIIDNLIIVAYYIVVSLLFLSNDMFSNDWLMLVFILPAFFYDLLSEVFMNGQSVGKRVMNMKVVSLDGGSPGLGQYMLRWIFRIIDFSITFYLCGFICVAVSEKRQRLGDMVAGTTLVKTNSRTTLQQTLFTPVEETAYKVSYPEVANLADMDVQLIKEVILNVNKTGNSNLAFQAAEKIKNILQINSELEPVSFLQLLLADYNYLTSRG
jgi:uncharacterized RDD family membrane protein YckC